MPYPKDRDANLAWRKELRGKAAKDRAFQKAQIERCRADLLYFVNAYGWLAEQRAGMSATVIPFVTFDFQDDAFRRLEGALRDRKIVIGDKSRDMGFTWKMVFFSLHRWLFFPHQSIAVASRSEEYVDKTGNPDCLFWKFDHGLEMIPDWMRPKFVRNKKHLLNKDNKSDIAGYATTKDIARGGRRLMIFLDELAAYHYADGKGAWAACESATDCIVAISTHQGTTGAFAEAVESAKKHPDIYEHIVLRWHMDPRKNQGILTVGDKPVPGMSEWTLRNRQGQLWSPWYEWKCKRLHYNKKAIAEELDADPAAAGFGFFSEQQVAVARGMCRPPIQVGRLIFETGTCDPIRYDPTTEGNLKLWVPIGPSGRPPPDEYASGCDVSAGVGATPSTMCIISKRTGEQVAEFSDSSLPPEAFARAAVAVAKFFWEAQLCWELPGPGAMFTRAVRESGYRSVYYRKTNEGGLAPVPSTMMGWHPSGNKRQALEMFRNALGYECLIRSEAVLDECKHYRYADDGSEVEQSEAVETDDPTKARHNHGDHLMAAVLAWMMVKDGKLLTVDRTWAETPRLDIPKPGSLGWMLEQERQAEEDQFLSGGLRL